MDLQRRTDVTPRSSPQRPKINFFTDFLIADFAEKEGLHVVYDINSAKIYNNKQ